MYKVLGKMISAGEFNGVPYKKYIVCTQNLNVNSKREPEGIITENFRCPYTERFAKLALDSTIDFTYDRFGKVIDFIERSKS